MECGWGTPSGIVPDHNFEVNPLIHVLGLQIGAR